jgi:hypothetical protein
MSLQNYCRSIFITEVFSHLSAHKSAFAENSDGPGSGFLRWIRGLFEPRAWSKKTSIYRGNTGNNAVILRQINSVNTHLPAKNLRVVGVHITFISISSGVDSQ